MAAAPDFVIVESCAIAVGFRVANTNTVFLGLVPRTHRAVISGRQQQRDLSSTKRVEKWILGTSWRSHALHGRPGRQCDHQKHTPSHFSTLHSPCSRAAMSLSMKVEARSLRVIASMAATVRGSPGARVPSAARLGAHNSGATPPLAR